MAYNSGNPNGQAVSTASSPVVIASDQSAIAVKGNLGTTSSASWTSGTAANTAVAMAVNAYNAVSIAVATPSTITAGAITFEVSPNSTTGTDGTWFAIVAARIDSYATESVYTLVASINRAWTTSVDGFTYFRVRLSTVITGTGTTSVYVTPQTFAIEPIVAVGNTTAANLQATVTGSVTLGAGTNTVGKAYITSASGDVATKAASTAVAATDIALAVSLSPNSPLPSGTNSIGGVTVNTTTFGINPTANSTALTAFSNQAVTATTILVAAGNKRLFEYDFFNPNSSGVWVQLFNATTAGAVTLGSTAPQRTIYIPPTSGRDWASPWSNGYGSGIVVACTTTSTGSTAPASAIQAYIGYV